VISTPSAAILLILGKSELLSFGGFHMHRAERALPILPHRFERPARRAGPTEALHQVAGLIGVAPDAEPENELTPLPVGELEWHLDGGARIQRGSHLAGKPRASHGRGGEA